jgi:hypothetical protein
MPKFTYGTPIPYDEIYSAHSETEGSEEDSTIPYEDLYGPPKKPSLSSGTTVLPGGQLMEEPGMSNGKKRLATSLGGAYVDEDFVDEAGDLFLTFKLGKAETEGKMREIVQSKYPEGDIKKFDLGEDGEYYVATKDGKTWKNVSDLSKISSDVVSGATAGALMVGGGPGAAPLVAIGKAALGAGLGSLTENMALKGFWEPERSPAAYFAMQEAALSITGDTVGRYALSPVARRIFGTKGSPGADAAVEATRSVEEGGAGLMPITGGQFTESLTVKPAYRQSQIYSLKSREEAMKRFKSLRDDGLLKWIEEDPKRLEAFSKDELSAMVEEASFRIDRGLADLSTGTTPRGATLSALQTSLDVFNKGTSKLTADKYQDAFDRAVIDDVAIDTRGIKRALDNIELGTPVKTDVKKPSGAVSDAIGTAGGLPAEEMIPERYLTPNAELQTQIDKFRNVSDILTTINPDGDYIGSLQQLNAVRRGFSEIAWKNAGTNQGRLAVEVLDAIDEAIANPVSGFSKDYQKLFTEAQGAYGTWKTVKELKAISKLNEADPSTYATYVDYLSKPGMGPIAEIMQGMFKSDPKAMESVRSTFVSNLVRNPKEAAKTIKELERDDPRLINVLMPNPADRKILTKAADDLDKLNSSWMVKAKEMSDLSLAAKAVDFYKAPKEEVFTRVEDFIKYGGPNAKGALQTGFVQYLLDMSETGVATELGDRLVSADAVRKLVDSNQEIIKKIFDNPKAAERLKHVYNYANKIKDTGVNLPSTVASGMKSSNDMGSSLMAASQGSNILGAAEDVPKKGIVKATIDIFAPYLSSGIVARIINLDGPITSDRLGKGVSEKTYESLLNLSRAAPVVWSQAQDKVEGDRLNNRNAPEDAYLP